MKRSTTPAEFWRANIPQPLASGWVEDSSHVSTALKLSRREVLGLVLLAHARGAGWGVGFDALQPEPNDGFIEKGTSRYCVESKLIPQYSKDVLSDILQRYDTVAGYGDSYGRQRLLVLLANAGDGRAVRISDLRHTVGSESPFDRVILMTAVSDKGNGLIVFHLYQPYPESQAEAPGAQLTQVDFDIKTGNAAIPHRGIDWDGG